MAGIGEASLGLPLQSRAGQGVAVAVLQVTEEYLHQGEIAHLLAEDGVTEAGETDGHSPSQGPEVLPGGAIRVTIEGVVFS